MVSISQRSVADFVLSPIGHVVTPWQRGTCPKNMREARERGQPARLLIGPAYREGLLGIERASHLVLLGWFGAVDRTSLRLHPKHLPREQGCFSLRSPARPNPIGMSVVRRLGQDVSEGIIDVDALDWFDGTTLLDVKPYYATTDAHPDATVDHVK